jgi:peptidoglycan/xylan/chitin deacetylase (PgdA/CDA1 family)
MIKGCILGLLALLSLVSVSFADGKVVVLCYHTFLGKNFDTDFTPERFEKQIQDIRDLGYRYVSFEDILSNKVDGDNNILLTIDDGNHSMKRIYDSVLMKYGIKPIIFIYPAITDHVFFSVTTADLKDMMQKGATIGGHGYYHLFITQKLLKRDPQGFKNEIFKSKERLEAKLDIPIDVFAYPFGAFSPVTIDYLKQAGFKYSFSLKQSSMLVPLSRNPDQYDLPRWMVTKSSWNMIFSMLKKNVRKPTHV